MTCVPYLTTEKLTPQMAAMPMSASSVARVASRGAAAMLAVDIEER